MAAAIGTATFGLALVAQMKALDIICLGVPITLSNNSLSYAYHAYQAELFTTRRRARAASLMIGFFLDRFATFGVFGFIAASITVVCISIGLFGPRKHQLALEAIA